MNDFNGENLIYGDLPDEIRREKKIFARILTGLTLAAFASYIFVFLVQIIIGAISADLLSNMWVYMGTNELYSICVAILFWCFTLKIPSVKPVPMTSIRIPIFLASLCVSVVFILSGSLIGNALTEFVAQLSGREIENNLQTVIDSISTTEVVIFVVILGPIIEEIIFRKLLIDKLSRYGSSFSIIISAILFGLFHGNFYQFFYAAGIGLVLGCLYAVSGKLRYSVILHMVINFMGSVAAVNIEKLFASSNLYLQLLAAVYLMLYLTAVPFGIIFLIKAINRRKLYFVDGVLIKPSKIIWFNYGVLLFAIYTLAIFAINIIF